MFEMFTNMLWGSSDSSSLSSSLNDSSSSFLETSGSSDIDNMIKSISFNEFSYKSNNSIEAGLDKVTKEVREHNDSIKHIKNDSNTRYTSIIRDFSGDDLKK